VTARTQPKTAAEALSAAAADYLRKWGWMEFRTPSRNTPTNLPGAVMAVVTGSPTGEVDTWFGLDEKDRGDAYRLLDAAFIALGDASAFDATVTVAVTRLA